MRKVLAAVIIAAILAVGYFVVQAYAQMPSGMGVFGGLVTEMHLYEKGLDVTVLPTSGNTVSGTLTVRLNGIPVGSGKITAMIVLPDSGSQVMAQPLGQDMKEAYFDTTKVADGAYNVTVVDEYGAQNKPWPWLARVSAQITVKNSGG